MIHQLLIQFLKEQWWYNSLITASDTELQDSQTVAENADFGTNYTYRCTKSYYKRRSSL